MISIHPKLALNRRTQSLYLHLNYGPNDYTYTRLAWGISMEWYDEGRAAELSRDYGDNWLSRILARKPLPQVWVSCYFFAWTRTFIFAV